MFLPNEQNAFIDDRKLIDYCLSENHPIGKHKARVFMSALGFSLEHFQELKEGILNEILESEATQTEINQYGVLYVIDVNIKNPPKEAMVKTSWIVRKDEDFPRLTSCYVIS
jgi:hypothetical protein